jgi:hypothetical protein
MATQRDESGDDPNIPPGFGKHDEYLYREIVKVGLKMHEIVKVVDEVPARIDARIDPVNRQLATIVSTIESHSKTVEIVESIRKTANRYLWLAILAPLGSVGVIVLAVWSAGHYYGSSTSTLIANVAEIKTDMGEMKNFISKHDAVNYDLNGNMKAHDERLKNMEEQHKAEQNSTREAAGKSSERIVAVLEAIEKRTGTRIDAIERKLEETSDVLVWSLNLSSDNKPEAKSDTHLVYVLHVPPQQKRANTIKGFLSGAVTFFEGEQPFRPPGLGAAAYPQGDGVRIELYFQDKSSLEGFVKRLETRRVFRLKITFALG